VNKIICISGSSRRGNTERLIRTAVAELKESGADVVEVYLSEFTPTPCDGCLRCDEDGVCHYDDGMNELNEHLASADGVLFGTPERWALLSGNLKTFMDRTNPLAGPERLQGKKAAIIAVGQCEGAEAKSIHKACESVSKYCESAGMTVIGYLVVEGVLEPDDIDGKPDAIAKAKRLAHDLIAAVV